MIAFKFIPTKDDYIKSFRTFYLSSWPIWAVLIVFVLLQLLCAGFMVLRGDQDFRYWGFPAFLLLFVVLLLAFMLIINPLTVARKVEKDERLHSLVQYEVNDEQIIIKNQFVENKLDWGSFQKVIESKELFLLVHSVNKNMFQIIPKRAFASTDDMQAFRDLVNLKIPKQQKSKFDLKKPAVLVSIVIAVGFGLLLCAITTVSFLYSFLAQ